MTRTLSNFKPATSGEDGSSPSFFALAPTEEAFLNLLPATRMKLGERYADGAQLVALQGPGAPIPTGFLLVGGFCGGGKMDIVFLFSGGRNFFKISQVCETGGWMEKDNRTILHLAAEKNFGRPFVEAGSHLKRIFLAQIGEQGRKLVEFCTQLNCEK